MSSEKVTVSLTVLKEHADKTEEIFERIYDQSDETEGYTIPCEEDYDGVVFRFYEVSNGELPFLSLLTQAGIAYDVDYEGGYDFYAGTGSCRFTSTGEIQLKTVWAINLNPPLDALLKLVDQPKELKAYIMGWKSAITPLPWTNQVEYGKRYQMTQLINPNQ